MRGMFRFATTSGLWLASSLALTTACGEVSAPSGICNPQCQPGQPYCLDPNTGDRVTETCEPYCPAGDCGDNTNTNGGGNSNNTNTNINNNNNNNDSGNNNNTNNPPAGLCECSGENAIADDPDQDCITTANEEANGLSDPALKDTDGDGINDGCEDSNRNGVLDPGETDPGNPDSDGDGIPDNIEDANQNGVLDPGETSPTDSDTDRDGIPDGVEDANQNGVVDGFDDINGDGCWDRDTESPGESDPRKADTDGDLILDFVEDRNQNGICDVGETCAFAKDTDCDDVNDGAEDMNQNGVLDPFEMNPLSDDTDGDGIPDGIEDANKNGQWDPATETNARSPDTDNDGILDGEEDRNHDGIVDLWEDSDGDGCYTHGVDVPGESNPRSRDSDGDGIGDSIEDKDRDGLCRYGTIIDPTNPGNTIPGFEETCAFLADTDCDGLADGLEDATRDGVLDPGELDPRNPDSDFDGLIDGCRAGSTEPCEDLNNDGGWDRDLGETNPRTADTDGDGLLDGCEVNFVGGPTDPLNEDTDGDGIRDGDEDANRNCQVDPGETDPRVAEPPPAEGTEDRIKFNVCSAQNVKRITFAESIRLDYRLAFEVERGASGIEAEYSQLAFGFDGNDDGFFDGLSTEDTPIGHIFQSPAGVVLDPADSTPINRDVYGFIMGREDGRQLDALLDAVREDLVSSYPGAVTEISAVTSRPTHDDLPNFRVQRAQREFALNFAQAQPAYVVRDAMLESNFLDASLLDNSIYTGAVGDAGIPNVLPVLPNSDPVYGNISCATRPELCYNKFRLSVAAVQRLDQAGRDGDPIVLVVYALVPDDTNPALANDPANRLFEDRLVRLEDLAGGSSIARFAAETSTTCEKKDPTQAKADVLWVVDDSRSMQQIIDTLQRAAKAAEAVFTANSEIVDFRLAMTTTNPSNNARRICQDICDENCEGSSDFCASCTPIEDGGVLGCIKFCPDGCDVNCGGGTCTADGAECNPGAGCYDPAAMPMVLAADASVYAMPGGGGTFFYEDSLLFDCDSNFPGAPTRYLNYCGGEDFIAEFAPFYAASGDIDSDGSNGVQRPPIALTANAGFIGSDPEANCQTALMDLSYQTDIAGDCIANPEECCSRLTDACSDGPKVLASQMCDLIRQMGGKPNLVVDPVSNELVPDQQTSGTRAHSLPEIGTRQARRLFTNALPAQPSDLAGPGELRLNCESGEANCTACSPDDPITYGSSGGRSCVADFECDDRERCFLDDSASAFYQECVKVCDIVPTVTVFLSDEEDFFFKDECAASYSTNTDGSAFAELAISVADKRQLPSECRYVDGNPSTVEPCLEDDDTPFSYCDGFDTGLPTGYDPDMAPAILNNIREGTLAWRDPSAAACDPLSATSCVGDPCVLIDDQTTCENSAPELTVCDADGQNCAPQTICSWVGGSAGCMNACESHNRDSATAVEARNACEADTRCRWDQSLAGSTTAGEACQMVYPLNDCQPCKRLVRREQAANGGDGLVGLGQVGPVYAITRNRGAPGSGGATAAGQDSCRGGLVTWGRGDGSAYRDLAIDTLGRTQDVCAEDYQAFIQNLVRDIVTLSAPYPLAGFPISSTIRVGIGRPDGSGNFDFFDVPRSSSSGFIYDGTSNSVGFKSDPIDGVCENPGVDCDADGVIEEAEVLYARVAPHIPQDGDVIYISYRFWEPVPCEEQCGDEEVCVRVLCPDEGTGQVCGNDSDCPSGEICTDSICAPDCTPGDTLDRCLPAPCGPCETFNPGTQQCIPITDTCECNSDPNAIFCLEDGSCPPGLTCLEASCVCSPAPGCEGVLDGSGIIANQAQCDDAKNCCASIAAQDEACLALGAGACNDANCEVRDGACHSIVDRCCPAGDEFDCQQDNESPFLFPVCLPGACSCEFEVSGGGACAQDSDCYDMSIEDDTFQPLVCDESSGSCICNNGFLCDENTASGCGCVPRPF